MRRIVRGAALVVGGSLAITGCGVDRTPRQQSTVGLTAAVLSQKDLPADFLPAEDQEVFGRVEPRDPDCRWLLALADLRGLRDVPQTHSVFYRAAPGATLAEHVVALTPAQAAAQIQSFKQAAAGCPAIQVGHHARRLRLHRTAMNLAGLGKDSFGVRYRQYAGSRQLTYDIVMVQDNDWLLVLTQPSVSDTHHRATTEQIAVTALRILRADGAPPPVSMSPTP
ncbi:MAG: hypothetical protein JWN00_5009 [Actinomycetia bacterium]|nr:hypothetical protein [Actinomycetes bacterium]